MFNVKLYTTFKLSFIVIFSFKIIFKKKKLFLILDFQQILSSCEFKNVIVFEDFKVENDILGLEQNVYLSIVKFLNSLKEKLE
jgi:hypothetical protein